MNEKNNELIDAVVSDALSRAKRLLEEGADANAVDEEGRPALLLVIRNRASKEMAELLLDKGADLGWTTEEGVGLLDEAVERNRLDLAELFIDRGIDPAETKRQSGMTALMLAACFEHLEMMELLYERGADLYAVDQMGFSAADFARKLRKPRAQKWIEEKMENPF
ncbi:ankyrin repeat domain-containing protein [Hydrogenimonas sp.]